MFKKIAIFCFQTEMELVLIYELFSLRKPYLIWIMYYIEFIKCSIKSY